MGDRPLCLAARAGNTERVLTLIRGGADVNEFDSGNYWCPFALWAACDGNHVLTAQALIENGADMNSTNADGETPILYFFGTEQIRRMLINAGANLHAQNEFGENILSYVARSKKHDLMVELVSCGMDISHCDFYGNSVLHDAAALFTTGANEDKIKIITTILDLNADINTTNNHGDTALHTAATMGSEVAARVLLQRNASIRITNLKGFTAKQVAWRHNHTEIVRMIEDAEREEALQSQRLAIAMSLHPRLGDEASMSKLGMDIIATEVAKFLREQH